LRRHSAKYHESGHIPDNRYISYLSDVKCDVDEGAVCAIFYFEVAEEYICPKKLDSFINDILFSYLLCINNKDNIET
jgi:hypothetical protein